MNGMRIIGLAMAAVAIVAPVHAQAATAEDAKAALAKAESAEAEAGRLRNQWTTTEDELQAARKALAVGDFDNAIQRAARAEALATRSIAQTHEQDAAWPDAVLK